MKQLILSTVLLFTAALSAQTDSQTRYTSDTRQYYVWSEASKSYIMKENELENSVIDIREIGSRSNGYISISLVDDGIARLYHGSITAYSVNTKNEPTWQLRSKTLKSKLTYNPEEHSFTYLYEADEKRYNKIFIFKLKPEANEDKAEN
ncbi:hypothetical protein FLLO111716_10665 [Flavobacterium longum]|uniref:hypothetical protein n=1 Tax=Flavobacterium longum TaxID=1299340 RepID=UPI0039EB743A